MQSKNIERTNSSQNINTPERVASAIAGGALAGYGVRHGGLSGAMMSLLGAGLLIRGTTGHSYFYDAVGIDTSPSEGRKGIFTGTVHVKRAVTVQRSADELYSFWRNFQNLPLFMAHLESVTRNDDRTSHWRAKGPLGTAVEWDAEVTSDIRGQRIGWKSLEGADITNSGVVEFKPTKERGTEVKVSLTYESPGGKAGEWIAWLLGEEPSLQVKEDLRRFQSLMETGQVMKVEGQPSGREPLPRALRAAGGQGGAK